MRENGGRRGGEAIQGFTKRLASCLVCELYFQISFTEIAVHQKEEILPISFFSLVNVDPIVYYLSCTGSPFMWLLGKADPMPCAIVFHQSEEVRGGGAKCMLCNFSNVFPHLCVLFILFYFLTFFGYFVKWNKKQALFGKSELESLLAWSRVSVIGLCYSPLVHKHTLVNPQGWIPVLGFHLNIFIRSWKKNDYLCSFNFHHCKFSTLPSKCLQELMEKENKSIPSFVHFCWGCEKLRSWGDSTPPLSVISFLSLILLPKELLLTLYPALPQTPAKLKSWWSPT